MLTIGQPAPDFELLTDQGTPLRLSDLRGRRVLLFFYPQDDTPGCTRQACGFRDAFPRISAGDAVVLGVSPDSPASHRKFRAKLQLPYTLLSDPEHRVAEAYGAWGQKKLFGKVYEGIIRSHVIVDAEGNVADVQIKVSPEDSVSLGTAGLLA